MERRVGPHRCPSVCVETSGLVDYSAIDHAHLGVDHTHPGVDHTHLADMIALKYLGKVEESKLSWWYNVSLIEDPP